VVQFTTLTGLFHQKCNRLKARVVIKSADTAMYHAKENRRNNFQFFKEEMNLKAVERRRIHGLP